MARNLACSKLTFSYAKPTWSRDTRVCDPNRDRTNMQHKKQVLQYRKNSSHLTKSQRYTNMVNGRGPLGNTVWASQSETVTIPNNKPDYPTVSNRIMCVNTYSCNPAGACVRTLDATQTKAECEASCVRNDYACAPLGDASYGFCRPGERPEGGVTLKQCESSGCPVWGCLNNSTSCRPLPGSGGGKTKAECEASGCSYDCSYVCNHKFNCSGFCIQGPSGNASRNACDASCRNCVGDGGVCGGVGDNDCCKGYGCNMTLAGTGICKKG
jgi:hypothetical protein